MGDQMTATSMVRFQEIRRDISWIAPLALVLATSNPAVAEATQIGGERGLTRPDQSIMHIKSRRWFDVQLEQIRGLGLNWDGYGAEPIAEHVVSRLNSLLSGNAPQVTQSGSIVPGADGSLQAEWHIDRSSFGLLVEDSGQISCWLRRPGQPEIEAFGLEAIELFGAAVRRYLS